MGVRVGIVGVSGYGGSELLRLCVGHPAFEVVYASGETTAGQRLDQQFPALAGHPTGGVVIQPFVPEELHGVDVLFASLAHGQVAGAPRAGAAGREDRRRGRRPSVRRGLDVRADRAPRHARAAVARSSRVADPGCYPAAALLALAPLVAEGLVEPEGLVVDAKTGVSGAGRGGGTSAFGYAETNEDVLAYGLAEHPHVPEMQEALSRLAGRRATLAFTPHLVPMTRGILATCYARPRGAVTPARLEEAARALYRDEPFVRVMPVAGRAESPHQVDDRLERRLRRLRGQPGDRTRPGRRPRSTTSARAPRARPSRTRT